MTGDRITKTECNENMKRVEKTKKQWIKVYRELNMDQWHAIAVSASTAFNKNLIIFAWTECFYGVENRDVHKATKQRNREMGPASVHNAPRSIISLISMRMRMWTMRIDTNSFLSTAQLNRKNSFPSSPSPRRTEKQTIYLRHCHWHCHCHCRGRLC